MEPNVEGMWDTHIHCLDPALYPFKSTRSYTPAPAPLEALIQQSRATRLVLVQASIENGPSGLLSHLGRIRADYPHILARGIICMDENWGKLTNEDFDHLHGMGVRWCRIHAFFGGSATDAPRIQEQIRLFAQSYPFKQWGWGLSAQLPLKTWASLKDFILYDPEVSGLRIMADHVACASPTDIGGSNLDNFVQLLQAGRVIVKVSALYRRCGKDITQMKPIIQRFAESASFALIWGSDWPHVDATNRDANPQAAPKLADPNKELVLLQSWLSSGQFQKMLVDNPERLFGS
ncbi:hypothetical protein N7474_008773 [Penicillium riverlandense]|uniref:uncharacterized protein n=1 Tax=Penicillium riverlandense TaxID=1903569 RepID=UPI002547DAEA|nr:uncharacterized protein N7474_008773 [Penicillium riverlandense]KAJ5812472.1 hypothetical protein N7474_008773 [Penicillium riverlandense]